MEGRGLPTESQGVTRNNSLTNSRSEVKMMRPDTDTTTKDSESSERSQVVVDQAVEQVVETCITSSLMGHHKMLPWD